MKTKTTGWTKLLFSSSQRWDFLRAELLRLWDWTSKSEPFQWWSFYRMCLKALIHFKMSCVCALSLKALFVCWQHVSDPGDGVAHRARRRPLRRRPNTRSGFLRRSRSHSRSHTKHLGDRRHAPPQPLQPVEYRGEQPAGRAHRDL